MKVTCSNCQTQNSNQSKYCSICGYKLPIVNNPDANETQQVASKPKKSFDIKRFLGFAIAFVVAFFVVQMIFKPSIDSDLSEVANEINKTCPMNVDKFTTLLNVAALPNKTLRYNYKLTMLKEEIQLDTVKKYLFPEILQNVKTSPDMKALRDKQVTFNYYYSDKDGNFVTQYAVEPEMYE